MAKDFEMDPLQEPQVCVRGPCRGVIFLSLAPIGETNPDPRDFDKAARFVTLSKLKFLLHFWEKNHK
jgi:hypothetical protein